MTSNAADQVLPVFIQTFQGSVFPLFIAAVFVLIVVAIGVYVAATSRTRAEARVAQLVRAYDMVTKQLSEAQKIGHFGSFMWDFRDMELSTWSDEMYHLFGLVPRKKAPDVNIFSQSADPKEEPGVRESWTHARDNAGPFAFSFRAILP